MKMPLVLSALCVMAAVAFASEPGVSRPGGDYQSSYAASADSCSARCAEDNLCMAWTYQADVQECELKAVVPPAVQLDGATSGVAHRAGAFAAAAPAPAPPPPQTPAPDEPLVPTQAARTASPHDPDDDLLGGDEGEIGLRNRLADGA